MSAREAQFGMRPPITLRRICVSRDGPPPPPCGWFLRPSAKLLEYPVVVASFTESVGQKERLRYQEQHFWADSRVFAASETDVVLSAALPLRVQGESMRVRESVCRRFLRDFRPPPSDTGVMPQKSTYKSCGRSYLCFCPKGSRHSIEERRQSCFVYPECCLA